jgi:hypothetical protein
MLTCNFVRVPQKSILLENGDWVEVAEFMMAEKPVSVSEFQRFVLDTGYTTSAESAGDGDTFSENYVLSEYSQEFRSKSPVQFVSFNDAAACSRWAGAALPDEYQWIAAATIDSNIYNYRSNVGLMSEMRRRMHIDVRGAEFTSTMVGENVVVRSGPIVVRWKESWPGRWRHLYSPDHYEPGLTFRFILR